MDGSLLRQAYATVQGSNLRLGTPRQILAAKVQYNINADVLRRTLEVTMGGRVGR